MRLQTHWNRAYADGDGGVSWFQADAGRSLELVRSVSESDAAVLDVGGGSARLVDRLLEQGYTDLAVLDVSESALDVARDRLGDVAGSVEWIVADILEWTPERRFDVWHDRAVLHFLTTDAEREVYLTKLRAGLVLGGHFVVGTFAEDGPEQCSGLPVRRQSQEEMRDFLGEEFEVERSFREDHTTPRGGVQPFNWTVARRVG